MKILVYPHDLNMGGSQMNAIELAAAMAPLGAECTVFGRPGVLKGRIAELGLEFIDSVDPGRRPSPAVVRQLRGLVSERSFDIVHGYEWPPTLEARLAVRGSPATVVSTVMSMAVAPFIPTWVPLVVGTQQIAATERATGRPRVERLDPPVDLSWNQAPHEDILAAFRQEWGLDGRLLVVCVTRLAAQLKLEGLLTAIDVASRQNEFQLLIVGDGPARVAVDEAATRANASAGLRTVVLTGELLDPRPAYAVADIVLGMGGSALRALAFAKPLVVQGERGFFESLTEDTLQLFQWQGWFGMGESADVGSDRLRDALGPLLSDANLRNQRGMYGRQIVEEFSLVRAAERQLDIYRDALALTYASGERGWGDVLGAGAFLRYHAGRRWSHWRGRRTTDDFNAAPVAGIAARKPIPHRVRHTRADGVIIYMPGVAWDAVHGTDHHLATALARHQRVLWVDPPQPFLRNRRFEPKFSVASQVKPNITRLSVTVPPGVTRPGVRRLSVAVIATAVGGWVRDNRVTPSMWICSATEPLLATVRPGQAPRIYLATDDFVAAAPLWKMHAQYLHTAREKNLANSELVLAVTDDLASILRRGESQPIVFPNGCDLHRYQCSKKTPSAADVSLRRPIAGVVGQFNDRTAVEFLEAVQEQGLSLLLVGPRRFASSAIGVRFDKLISRPNVQWVDRVPENAVISYLRCMDVGLTPYDNSAFNRRSFPLKTLEYLAAGLPVVTTAVPPRTGFDPRFVQATTSPAQFAAAAEAQIDQCFDPSEIRASVSSFDWRLRAEQLLDLVDEWRR